MILYLELLPGFLAALYAPWLGAFVLRPEPTDDEIVAAYRRLFAIPAPWERPPPRRLRRSDVRVIRGGKA